MPVRSPPAAPEGVLESDRRESLPAAACVEPVPSVLMDGVAAEPSLLALLEPIRESFNVNGLGLVAAQAALADAAHLQDVVTRTQQEREWLAAALRSMGVRVLPSQTNFLLAHFGPETPAIENALFERGAIVRPMAGYGLGEYLRITVATRSENERLLAGLKAVIS